MRSGSATPTRRRRACITRADFKQATGHLVKPGDDVYIYPNNYTVMGAGGAAQSATPGPASGSAFRGEAVEVRCSNAECGKLLAEAASAPYRMTCRHCKTVTEAEAPERPPLALVGERYEYDEAGRVAAIYDVSA